MAIDSIRRGRRFAFFYAATWVAALFLLAALYSHNHFRGVTTGIPFAGLASGWAGCLGGVAISLKGVYDHWLDSSSQPEQKSAWNNDLLLWHLGRPVSGAIVGVSVFLLIKAASPSGTPSSGAMAAAAFVLGMQEKRFFAWVKQIGAVVVAVPNQVKVRADQPGAGAPDDGDTER